MYEKGNRFDNSTHLHLQFNKKITYLIAQQPKMKSVSNFEIGLSLVRASTHDDRYETKYKI